MGTHWTLRRGTPIPPLTFDEMNFAMLAAHAARSGRMPFDQVDTRVGPGRVLLDCDDFLDRSYTFAILDSFKHDPMKAGAALVRYRIIAAYVLADDRTDAWLQARRLEDPDVFSTLIEAIATVPMKLGYRPPSIARVLRLADKLHAEMT